MTDHNRPYREVFRAIGEVTWKGCFVRQTLKGLFISLPEIWVKMADARAH